MTNFTQKLLGATALMAMAAGTASAQGYYDRQAEGDAQPDIIDQVQLGDVWSNVNVHVPSAQGNIVTSSTAIANTSTAIVERGDLNVVINQTAQGTVEANTDIWAGRVDGDVISSTSATGNSVYAANWHGNAEEVDIIQTTTHDTFATSQVDVADAWAVSTHATAVANTAEFETDFGEFAEVFQEQTSGGDVFAGSIAEVAYAEGFVQNSAIAAGNSASSHFSNIDEGFNGAVQTTQEGTTIVSSAQTHVGFAQDVFTTSAAVGNQFNGTQVDSYVDFGNEGSEFFQGNGSQIVANADAQIDYVSGISSTSATGVGNSFAVSSLGGRTNTDVIQTNFGDVSSDVRVNTGDFSGGAGAATATAFGNSFSSVIQEGRQSGGVLQTNFANVSANASIRTGRAGDVIATSTAIGNAATIETRANNNGRR